MAQLWLLPHPAHLIRYLQGYQAICLASEEKLFDWVLRNSGVINGYVPD